MIAEDCVDTKHLKVFIQIFNFLYCSYQTSITSVWNQIFWFCKSILKQMQCGIWLNKKVKNYNRQVLGPCVIYQEISKTLFLCCACTTVTIKLLITVSRSHIISSPKSCMHACPSWITKTHPGNLARP